MPDLTTMTLLVIGAYVVMSLVTFVAFGLDKRAARRGIRRTPENTLHLLELLCGWPGALVARHAFKHKRAKPRYMIVLWLIVATHAAFWAWWWFRWSN